MELMLLVRMRADGELVTDGAWLRVLEVGDILTGVVVVEPRYGSHVLVGTHVTFYPEHVAAIRQAGDSDESESR